MNIPTKDPLKPKPRLGTPQRGQSATKLVEGQTDAAKLRGVTVATTAPSHGQVPSFNAVTAQYEPISLASLSSSVSSETIFSSIAKELQDGPSYIRAGSPLGALTAGDWVIAPSGIQRMEALTIPRVGAFQNFSPSCAVGAAGIATTTQTTFTYTSTGDPITAGVYIVVLGASVPEAMFVTGVDTGTNTLTVVRGRLQTAAATATAGASIQLVTVQAMVQVTGGLKATGGVATSDLALHGSSTQEFLVCAKFTPTPPTPTYVGIPDGSMQLHVGEHSHAANTNYRVEIDTAGATGSGATFRWSADGGGTWLAALQPVTQNTTHLQAGVAISWDYGTYQVGSRWDFTAIGKANQVELVRADTANDILNLRNIDVSATSDSFPSVISGNFIYTGTAITPDITEYMAINLEHRGTSAGHQLGRALRVSAQANRSAGDTSLVAAQFEIATDNVGAVLSATYISIVTAGYVVAPSSIIGINIGSIGHASATDTTGLFINPLAGATIYNIRQQGTTGVNRFGAPSLFGADASPLSGLALEVTGVAAVSSQLLVGASALPAAGVALELRGGAFRMAASTDNYIQDSAGLRHLTFATSTTVVAVTSSFAGDLRVNDQLGVGGAVNTGARLGVQGWVSDVFVSGALIRANFDGTLGGNVTTRVGFEFFSVAQPSFDIAGFNITNLYGVKSAFAVGDTSATGVVTNHASFYGQSIYGGGLLDIVITDAGVYTADAPDLSGGSGFSVVTSQRAFWAKNQGATGIVDAIGVDVAAQSGASGLNIGIRIGLGATYSLQLSSTAGTAASGITFGTDVTLYRSAADVLKTDDKLHVVGELELDGALNHDGANVGFYGTAPATQQTPTGSRGGNAALASLLTALALTGLIVDGTIA